MYIPPSAIIAATNVIASTGVVQKGVASFSGMLEKAVDAITPGDESKKEVAKQSNFLGLDSLGPPRAAGQLNPINISDVRKQTNEALEKFRLQVNSLLAASGIDTTQPFDLTTGPDGRLQVSGDHPQAAEIQEILSSNPDLATSFNALSGSLSLLKAADAATEFQKAYADDPQKAVNSYSYLFDEKPDEQVSLRFENGNISTLFAELAVL